MDDFDTLNIDINFNTYMCLEHIHYLRITEKWDFLINDKLIIECHHIYFRYCIQQL